MSEVILFLQALLLVAMWMLFLRAQQELKAQAAKQSLVGEQENLRRTIEALLKKMHEEADKIKSEITEKIEEARNIANSITVINTDTLATDNATATKMDNVYILADKDLSPEQISQKTGLTLGEVELMLALRPNNSPYSNKPEGAP